MKYLVAFSILFFSPVIGVRAQQPHYLFQRLGVNDGLFEENIHAIQQDAKGFIWLNLRNIVQRYDGLRFMNFFPGVNLPEGNVRAMQIDKKNRLWLLNGEATLGYLDPDNFKYHAVKVNIPKGYALSITNMYLNRQDQVMLLWDKEGFITSNPEATEAAEKYNPFLLPPGWAPIHILQDEDLNYWIGTYNGLVKYHSAAKKLSYRHHNPENDPAIAQLGNLFPVMGVHAGKSKHIWVVSAEAGAYKIHSVDLRSGKYIQWEHKIKTAKTNYTPFGIIESESNGLWLTGDNIFCKLNIANETVQHIPNTSLDDYSIRYDVIYSFYEDREKNIWLGTNKGLFRFNPQAQLFTIIQNKRSDTAALKTSVTGFLENYNEELFVSTWGHSVFSYNSNFKATPASTHFQQVPHQMSMVWCMFQRANKDIWFGVKGHPLQIMDGISKKIYPVSAAPLEIKDIRQIAEDKAGNIWLGSQQGELFQWNAESGSYKKILQIGGLVSRICIDVQNRIWVCTDRDGLYCINSSDGNIIQHYSAKGEKGKKLLFQGVTDIIQYNDSTFYISGNGLSILNTRTNSFQYFTIANGLPSANITNLVKDKNGNIWMTTGSGIVSYHPVKSKISHYTTEDGVHNYSFNVGAAKILKNGNIAFGTNQDIIVFNPAELTSRRYLAPRVQISRIEIMGITKNVDSIQQLSLLELAHNKNAFKFLFTTLSYKDVHQVFYMLEGIDKTWKRAGRMNVVEYNYLPHGNYVLKAVCFEENGKPGVVTSIKIHVAAPFYNSWWFYGLIVLLLGWLLFWFDRERTKRKEATQQLRSKIAGQLHEEVNTALNNINILSEIARLKAGTEPDKAIEFIDQIHGRSHNMIIAMDDMLWSIAPENDSMQKAIERMREYIDALKSRHAVQLDMLVDEKVNSLQPDMQTRHEAFLLFREGLKSLVESGVVNCKIHIATDKNLLLYTLQFNTESCDLLQLNNKLQRQDMSKRLNSLQAKMNVAVHMNTAVLEFKVPMG